MNSAETDSKSPEKVYIFCKYNCNSPIEQSAMSSHLHVCPNRPKKNEILEIIQQPDPNEFYIPTSLWPENFPKSPEVLEYIRNSGYVSPIDLPPPEYWVEVTPRVKKNKESSHKAYRKKNSKK